jgi:DNA repair protein RadC
MENQTKTVGKEVNDLALRPMKIRLMLVREGRARKAASVTNPKDAFNLLLKEARGADREKLWRIDLDTRSNVLGFEEVSVGTINASLVHPREVFKGAILQNAAAIIIVHNHPSQDTTPSAEDKDATRRIQRSGELLGIPLLDHLIVADRGFYSFKDGGLL